jgi:integrase
MPQQLPSGRWRTRVRHPRTGKQVSARTVIGGPDTYATEPEALAAESEARRLLHTSARVGVTVGQWWTEWTTDPLWARPSESTNIHYRERTERFAREHWDTPIRTIGDDHVAAWLKAGNRGTVDKLRTMFADAASAPAGRLVDRNPFANLRLPGSRGRKDVQPPNEADIQRFIAIADELTPPSFAAYLDVAVHTGMRPGELDALRWAKIDVQAETILVDAKWCPKTKTINQPKHHHVRTVALTEPARDRLLRLPRESEWTFTTLYGTHYKPTSRIYHWNRVRAAAGYGNVDLYTVTRHFFGWYAFNILCLPDHVIAAQLGHRDGGKLVRTTYGHPDERIARDRVREAYRDRPTVPTPLVTVASKAVV